jgi:putative redox protein
MRYYPIFVKTINMVTSDIKYTGKLRTEAIHTQSGTVIHTDAPKDNHGLGAAFSPTDLVATALATCIVTTIAIKASQDGMTGIEGATAEVLKVMYSEPRRIGEIHVKIVFPKNNYSEKEKKIYENTAHACPVAKSLHPELKQVLAFVWP